MCGKFKLLITKNGKSSMNHGIDKMKNYLKDCVSDPVLYCFAAGLMMLLIVENNLVINL